MRKTQGHRPTAHPAEPPQTDKNRRGILAAMFGSLMGIGFAVLGLASGLWAAIAARFMVPNVHAEPPRRFKVGFPGDYPPDRVETRFQQQYGVWVVNGVWQGQRQIFALRTICTHLGCVTIWQPSQRRFKCPCHGSGFYADGRNFEGPAPRALDRCALRLADDGQLEIDTGRTFQAELGQWDDPASYVPA